MLTTHQCDPGSNPDVDAICGLSLLLVLFLAPRGFSLGTLFLPSSQKTTLPVPNSNLTRNQVDKEPLCGCPTSKSLFIYLFIYQSRIHKAKKHFKDVLPLNGYRFIILLKTLPGFSFSLTSVTNVNIFSPASL